MQTYWIGIVLAVAASLMASLGLACIRFYHNNSSTTNSCHSNDIIKSPTSLWYLGYALQAMASLVDVVSFGFAPISLLSCMAAMTLIFNLWLAPLICGEVVSRRDCQVNIVVFLGIVVSLWFGPHETPLYNLQQLGEMVKTTEAIIYGICLITWIGSLLCLWFKVVIFAEHTNDNSYDDDLKEDHHPSKQLDQEHHPTRMTTMMTRRARIVRLVYPVLAGSFGGNTVICAKALIFLIQTSVTTSENQFQYGGSYGYIVALIFCLAGQLYFLDGGMRRYDAVFVVPIYICFWMISSIMGALFFFQEIKHLSAIDIVFFLLGVLISLLGVLLHSTRPQQKEPYCISDAMAAEARRDDEEESGSSSNRSSLNGCVKHDMKGKKIIFATGVV